MATFTVSNNATLLSALAEARGGDIVVLAAGRYGSVSFNEKYASEVTLRSAVEGGAKFANLDFTGAGNISVEGVHVDNSAKGGTATPLVRIVGSANISLANSEVSGSDDNDFADWQGVYVRNADVVRIENNDIHDAFRGLMVFGSKNVEVVGNDFDDIGEDTMKFGSVDRVLIEDNFSTGAHQGGSHQDFVQVQGVLSSNMTIRGNVLLPEAQANMQGIFFGARAAHNVVVEDNFIHTRMYNGIAFGSGASEITITGNTLINMQPGKSTAISAPGGSTVTGNIITKYYKAAGMHEDNLWIQTAKPGMPGYVTDYYRNGDKGLGLRLDDLGIVRGSLAEALGAAGRLQELLGLALPELPSAPSSTKTVYSLAGAHDFSGHAADVVSVAPSAKLALDAATISFRFEADEVEGRYGLVTRDADGPIGGGNHFAAMLDNGKLTVKFENTTTWIDFSTVGIRAHKEYSVQAAFGDGKVYAWLNGTLIGSADFDTDWTGNQQYLQIGAHNGKIAPSGTAGFDRMFDGTISDLKIVDGLVSPTALAAVASVAEARAAAAPSGTDTPSPVWSRTGEADFGGRVTDIVKVAHDPAMAVTEGSLAFSFEADAVKGRQGLVAKDAPGQGEHVAAWLEGDLLKFRFEDGAKQAIFKVWDIEAGARHDLVATFDGSTVGLYVDGDLVGRKALAMDFADNHETLQIGGWDAPDSGTDAAFDGRISDVFLFDRVIAPDDLVYAPAS